MREFERLMIFGSKSHEIDFFGFGRIAKELELCKIEPDYRTRIIQQSKSEYQNQVCYCKWVIFL